MIVSWDHGGSHPDIFCKVSGDCIAPKNTETKNDHKAAKTTLPTLELSTSRKTLNFVVVWPGTVVGQNPFQRYSEMPPMLSVDSKMHAIAMTFAMVTVAIRVQNTTAISWMT